MWLAKFFSTVIYFNKPVLCEKHDTEKLENMSKEEITQSEEIFCVLSYIRKHVMDPFCYGTPYPPAVLGSWFKQLQKSNFKLLKKLPWESCMSGDQLEEDIDIVQFIHDTTTYILAAMTKVCVLCEKSKGNFSAWVNNTKEDTDIWHCLKEEVIDFKAILKPYNQYGSILHEICVLGPFGRAYIGTFFMTAIFFITFMIRYSIFSSESVESILAANQNIMEHTKKFTLEFPIGEHHLKDTEKLSHHLITLKGNEKESFSILLNLVQRATKYITLGKHKEAAVYSHALVTYAPFWCKAYFYLAISIYKGGERIHFAHCVASHGLMNCENALCPSCTTFQLYVEKWQQECSPMCNAPAANKLAIEGYQLILCETARISLYTQIDDVPELTDPSSSDESHSEYESDYEAAQEELPEVNKQATEAEQEEAVEHGETIQGEAVEHGETIQEEAVEHRETNQEKVNQKEIAEENAVQKEAISEEIMQKEVKETVQEESVQKNIQNGSIQQENLELKQQSSETKQKSIGEQNEVKTLSKPAKEADTKPPKNHSKKVEKARHKKEPLDETLTSAEIQEKMERFKILLKEGSAATTDGCGLSAVRNFCDALSELRSNPTIYKLEEYEVVCLKYAYGTACCKSGTYEDLQKAIHVFNEILSEHPNVRFPVAYFGLGLGYFKLNRFKDALSHFEMLQSIIDKGIQCTVYSWPGTVVAIEETKTDKLKILLNDLMAKCRSPPPPAAICRHENCLSRPEIYYSDPDFKGFTTIQCQDRCVLQYHPSCWKTLKDTLSRTDKDFLGQRCLTPDCGFIVMQIECIGKDGTSEKHFEIEDNEKVKKHKKSRLEKRLVMKEMKKRRRLESTTTSEAQSSSVSECAEVFDDNNEDEIANENIPSVTEQPAVKVVESSGVTENETVKKIESNLSAHAKPFYIRNEAEPLKENVKPSFIWKRDVESVPENEKVTKTKERKKAKKPVALSLDEFRQKSQDFSYYNEYQARLHHLQENNSVKEDYQTRWSTICETENIPQLDPNRPFHIPEDLREDPVALDAVLQSCSSYGRTDYFKVTKEKIYMHLEKILSFYGPMRIDDSVLLEEVAKFPASFQQMISDAGGLKDFMLESIRFAFVGDHICIVPDVVKAYSMGSESYNGKGYSDGCDASEDCELHNGVNDDDDDGMHDHGIYSYLNPLATEYNPISPVQSKSSISSGNSNSSPETHSIDIISAKDVEQESPETLGKNISSLNQLRKPLTPNGQNFDDLKESDNTESDQQQESNDLNVNAETHSGTSFFFSDLDNAYEHLAKDIKKLPDDKKFNMILKILNFILNEEYYAKNISAFNQNLKPFAFSLVPKKLNKRLQAGTPHINMHSKAVMKEDEQVKSIIEKFHDLEQYRNNMNEEMKVKEEKFEHALDTIAKLQNALSVAEKDKEKELEEVEALLEEEKKEFRKKEKNWEKEQKRLETSQAKMMEQFKIYREEIKNLKEELSKKDAQLKETEELKKATEINLAEASKSRSEAETSLHESLQLHEIEISTLMKKLQNAQLELLTAKKINALEKIHASNESAELRLKEIQDGLPMVNHPLMVEQLRSLQYQIKEHIVQLGKIHMEIVKAADEQICELKKGKDLSDLKPLAELKLPECPALKVPPNAATPMAPNSGSAQLGDQIFSLLGSYNQRLTASQNANFQGTSLLGNFPGLSGPSVSPTMGSYPVFDSSLYQNSHAGYYQKPTSSFQQNFPRAPVPPGLSIPMNSSSQGLPNNLPQASTTFHIPQTQQQSTSPASSGLQTPFSFGFPQLHNKTAVTQVNASEKIVPKSTDRSAGEAAFLNALKKTVDGEAERRSPFDIETKSEKSVSREDVSGEKKSISNPLSSGFMLPAIKKHTGSTCSSPVPGQSRDKSSHSNSSHPASVSIPEPAAASKQSFASVSLESTGVKPKQPTAKTNHKINGSSRSGASSVVSDYDSLNLEGSVPESSFLELGYTVKETEKASASVAQPFPSSSSTSGIPKNGKAADEHAKSVPTTNSYEKLLIKLMAAYPQHSRTELMECVSEFRKNNNNKLSNLRFGSIILGIGKILERRKSIVAQASQKKKPQLQDMSLAKKPAVAPPLSEKSGVCPWAKPEPHGLSLQWHGNSCDTSCSICLEEMSPKCSVKKLECGHRFHLNCLKEWLGKNSNCPICRVHVLLPEDYPSLS